MSGLAGTRGLTFARAAARHRGLPSHGWPRGPVLGWDSFIPRRGPWLAGVQGLPQVRLVTSGRAAICLALESLALPAGSRVLVPTYHCPTMVAPLRLAGLEPQFYGIGADGLPDLDGIAVEAGCRAMLVSHFFGLAQSLAAVRAWCDRHGIVLIEDCAHALYGLAGERTVGAWGDLATASLTKFLPVAEGGLLASATRAVAAPRLSAQGTRAQLKGWVDVLELAVRHRRLAGLRWLLAPVFALKSRRKPQPGVDDEAGMPQSEASMTIQCDLGRVQAAMLGASRALLRCLPRSRSIGQRQRNYAAYQARFFACQGARSLQPADEATLRNAAPYVFPLWVESPEPVYARARALGLPVFRWDRLWPGTPKLPGDQGPLWSHHVLQLACHQSLSVADVERIADLLIEAMEPDTL
ncbi:MAG: DegT/DnrJ/EryC1/StrS aminotransferase family protein [Paucibacter sp.]|nr:DegT/DnrJ/EryC1/StrS aminotransferase family protein [Roseateles sp.]